MGFLDKPVGEMDLEELTRLMRQIVHQEVPPIPAAISKLDDLDNPLVQPGTAAQADALVYDAETGTWGNGKISAESLEALMVLAGTIIAGDEDGARVEFGLGTGMMEGMTGMHSVGPDGETITFMIDAETGEVFVKGRLDFGAGSRLTVDDIIELYEQPTSFQEGTLVQAPSSRGSSVTSISTNWTSATTLGSLLLCAVNIYDADGTPPTPTTPAGWTLVANISNANHRSMLWKIENAASRSGAQSVTLNDTVQATINLFEYTGVEVQDVSDTSSGTDDNPDAGPTAASTQAEAMGFAAVHYTKPNADQIAGFTNDYDQITTNTDVIGVHSGTLVVAFADKNLTATGAQQTDITLDKTVTWVSYIVVFKAKVAGVDTPDTDKVRVYARDVGGDGYLHTKNAAGTTGAVVLGTSNQVWRLEEVTINFNPASVGAHASGAVQNNAVSGIEIGDMVLYAGCSPRLPAGFQVEVTSPADTADQLTFQVFNADTGAIDDVARDYNFLVIHRS